MNRFFVGKKMTSLLFQVSGTLGNTLVLIAFKTKFEKLKSQEIFFINLAIADLIGSIIMPTYFYLKLIEHDMKGIGMIKYLTYS